MHSCTSSMMHSLCSVSHSHFGDTTCHSQTVLSQECPTRIPLTTQYMTLTNPLRNLLLGLQTQHPYASCNPGKLNNSVISQYIWPLLDNPLSYLELGLCYTPSYTTVCAVADGLTVPDGLFCPPSQLGACSHIKTWYR